MKLSVLVPWRSSDPDRVRAWDFNRPRWGRLPVQLCVADDGRTEGVFSVARALNRAREEATGDALAVFGADHLPPDSGRLAWILDRLERYPWTGVYAATRVINQAGTARVFDDGMPPEVASILRFDWVGCCYGIIATRADVWDDVGGFDERFEGWGAEDTAFREALAALHPDGRSDGEGEAVAFWHADAPRDQTEANVARFNEYARAAREGWMRQYLQERRFRNG
jgi:hypothetical protein